MVLSCLNSFDIRSEILRLKFPVRFKEYRKIFQIVKIHAKYKESELY